MRDSDKAQKIVRGCVIPQDFTTFTQTLRLELARLIYESIALVSSYLIFYFYSMYSGLLFVNFSFTLFSLV